MMYYERLKEYVTLCQRALTKKSPLDQIESLRRVKQIMRGDLVLFLTNIRASHNWIRWWWDAVDYVHSDYHGNVCFLVDWSKKTIDFGNFMDWVDCLDSSETEYHGMRSSVHDIGPGYEHEDIGFGNEPEKIMYYPEYYSELNKRYPLLPTENKPIVTGADMAFRELLSVWTRAVRRLSREAVVEVQVEREEDAWPPEYMTDEDFIDNLKISPQTSEESDSTEDNTEIPAEPVLPTRNANPPEEQKKKKHDKTPLDATVHNESPQINDIPIDDEKARRLFEALKHPDLQWLIAPMDEKEFISRLRLTPTGKKIKLQQVNQVHYIAKNYLFPSGKMKSGAWLLVEQLFEAENGKIENVKKAYKKPEKFEILKNLMDENRG